MNWPLLHEGQFKKNKKNYKKKSNQFRIFAALQNFAGVGKIFNPCEIARVLSLVHSSAFFFRFLTYSFEFNFDSP